MLWWTTRYVSWAWRGWTNVPAAETIVWSNVSNRTAIHYGRMGNDERRARSGDPGIAEADLVGPGNEGSTPWRECA